MHLLYILSFAGILAAYRLFHPGKLSAHWASLLYFSLLYVFCCFLYNPFFTPSSWLVLCFLFYAALDDELSSTFNTLPFWILSPLVLYADPSLASFLGAALLYLLFSFLSRRDAVGEGEAVLLPFFFLLLPAPSFLPFLYLSAILAALHLFIGSLFSQTRKERAFLSSLVLAYVLLVSGYGTLSVLTWLTLAFLILGCFYAVQAKRRP